MGKYFIALITFLLIFCISLAGCVSSKTVQSKSNEVYTPISTPTLPQTCIGDCKIGQSATDGKYNHQKFTLNAAYLLKHPYNDPDPDIGKEWHNWDWVVLDVSLVNLRSEKSTDYGIADLVSANSDADITCMTHTGVELTNLTYTAIPPGEVRHYWIGCVIDPKTKLPLTYNYYFDDWYGEKSGNGGITAKFLIDQLTPLDYDSIKLSLRGEKPF